MAPDEDVACTVNVAALPTGATVSTGLTVMVGVVDVCVDTVTEATLLVTVPS